MATKDIGINTQTRRARRNSTTLGKQVVNNPSVPAQSLVRGADAGGCDVIPTIGA
jgi:hypothetical protein